MLNMILLACLNYLTYSRPTSFTPITIISTDMIATGKYCKQKSRVPPLCLSGFITSVMNIDKNSADVCK